MNKKFRDSLNKFNRVFCPVLGVLLCISLVFGGVFLSKKTDTLVRASEYVTVQGNVFLPITPDYYGTEFYDGGYNPWHPSTGTINNSIGKFIDGFFPPDIRAQVSATNLFLTSIQGYRVNQSVRSTPLNLVFQSDCGAFLAAIDSNSSQSYNLSNFGSAILPLTFNWLENLSTKYQSSSYVTRSFLNWNTPDVAYFRQTRDGSISASWIDFVRLHDNFTNKSVLTPDTNNKIYYYDVPYLFSSELTPSYDMSSISGNDTRLMKVYLYYSSVSFSTGSFSLEAVYGNGFRLMLTSNGLGGIYDYSSSVSILNYNGDSYTYFTPVNVPYLASDLTDDFITREFIVSNVISESQAYQEGKADGKTEAQQQYSASLQAEYNRGLSDAGKVNSQELQQSYDDGVAYADSRLNVQSRSYADGYYAGLSQGDSSLFITPVNAVNSFFNIELFSVGDFHFKLSYLVYIALGGLFISIMSKIFFHG